MKYISITKTLSVVSCNDGNCNFTIAVNRVGLNVISSHSSRDCMAPDVRVYCTVRLIDYVEIACLNEVSGLPSRIHSSWATCESKINLLRL